MPMWPKSLLISAIFRKRTHIWDMAKPIDGKEETLYLNRQQKETTK